MKFNLYQDAVHYVINEIPKTPREVFDDADVLARNQRMAELFDNPQDAHLAIHVAGTSGKGSVCYEIEAILRAHSKRTGMLVSPHVYNIRERIQLLGSMITKQRFVDALEELLYVTTENHTHLTYFETFTAMGFSTFARTRLDYQVIEVGMGGRLDATNVMTRRDKICVLTQIGLDHVEALGDTLEKIAGEKAGVIQPGNHVVALKQSPEVMSVFEKVAEEKHATLEWVEPAPEYELTNQRVAEAACRYVATRDGWKFDETLAQRALEDLAIPGRFEKREVKKHEIILDGAHNLQKLSALADRLERENLAPVACVVAMGERKDVSASIMALQPIAERIIATEFFTKEQDIPKRPVPAETITEVCHSLGIEAETVRSPEAAYRRALEYSEPIVVTGSFYLLGELDEFVR